MPSEKEKKRKKSVNEGDKDAAAETEMIVPAKKKSKIAESAKLHDEYLGEILAGLPQEFIKEQAEPEISAYAQKKFYKNASGSVEAQARKEASKRGKRLKYDLDAKEEDEVSADIKVPSLMKTEASNLDELRERLQTKLSEARGTRGRPDENEIAERRARKKGKKSTSAKKKVSPPAASLHQEKKNEIAPAIEMPDVTVATVRAPKTEVKTARAPGSKTKRLKALAAEAENKAATIASLRAQGKNDQADSIEWQDTLKIATGERRAPVDPAKIKKALKQREKKKEKSKIAWEKRLRDATPPETKKKASAGDEENQTTSRRAQRRERKKQSKTGQTEKNDQAAATASNKGGKRKRLAPWERPGSSSGPVDDDDNNKNKT